MKKAKTTTKPRPGPSKGIQKLANQIERQAKKNKEALHKVYEEAAKQTGKTPVNATKVIQVKDTLKLIIMRDGAHTIGFVRCFANTDSPVPFDSILKPDGNSIYVTYLYRIVHAVIPTKFNSTLTKMEFQQYTEATKDIITILPTDMIMTIQEPTDAIANKFYEELLNVSLEEKFPDIYKMIDTDSADQKPTNKEAVALRTEEFKRFIQSVSTATQERLSEELIAPMPVSGKMPINAEQTPVKCPLREFGVVEHRLSHFFIEGAKRQSGERNQYDDDDDD